MASRLGGEPGYPCCGEASQQVLNVHVRVLVAACLCAQRGQGDAGVLVEVVKQEVVGVDDRDVVGGGGCLGEVLGIEGDEEFGAAADGCGQDVAVLRVSGHAVGQALVAADLGVGEGSAHFSDPVADRFLRQSAL